MVRGGLSDVFIVVGFTTGALIVFFLIMRFRGHPDMTVRTLAWWLGICIPFMTCDTLSVVDRSLHWLLFVAMGISVLSYVGQFVAQRRKAAAGRSVGKLGD